MVAFLTVPVPPPTTRLRHIALGLDAIAAELELIIGQRPANLVHWRDEIYDIVRELEHPARQGERRTV
jgi:hypothetical protein